MTECIVFLFFFCEALHPQINFLLLYPLAADCFLICLHLHLHSLSISSDILLFCCFVISGSSVLLMVVKCDAQLLYCTVLYCTVLYWKYCYC